MAWEINVMTNLIAQAKTISLPPVAGDGKGLGGFSAVTDSAITLATIISSILGFLTIVGGLWFTVNFILAAVSWISAGGDKGKTQQAKDKITNAVIGLAIVVGAYAIAGLVGSILGLDFLNLSGAIKIISPNKTPVCEYIGSQLICK
jgi:hypothetical protein